MASLLSEEEINSLLTAFDQPTITTTPFSAPRAKVKNTRVGATLADIARRNSTKQSKEPDYLHLTIIDGENYYSSPGSTVMHPEQHAKTVFDFSKIRGLVRN